MSSESSIHAIMLLEEIKRLMELKGDNPFKIRAYDKAIRQISGRADLIERAKAGTLMEIDGIGKGISEVLTEFLLKGTSRTRDELASTIPKELVELTQIPGLGPKKAMELIDQLGIRTWVELEYACKENRLLKLKGFGPKIQQKILEGIQFLSATQGSLRIDDALTVSERVMDEIKKVAKGLRISETGALRRRTEILTELEYLIENPPIALKEKIQNLHSKLNTKVEFHFVPKERFGYFLAKTTGTPEHWRALGNPSPFDAKEEEDFYKKLKLPWIPPESRESGDEVTLAKEGKLKDLLPLKGVRGIFHNHTVRSDGTATLEEMVIAAKERGYEYIGISDHSQSAFYANGLKPQDLHEQEKEVRSIQEKHPEIRVFWGIESDILADGSLDYEPKVLKKFDFVIASIHARFKMEREAMTERILGAIRNSSTRFIGHITGRLLLGRKGYEVDMEKIIVEAARHDVAIEINSNPARLDIDWRWGNELRKRKTSVSINPDAHEIEGLNDVHFGITVARKALLPSSQVVNSRSAVEIERWLRRF